MKKLTLALDWTPNINHIGFFVGQDKGFYREQGLDVLITDPSEDDYKVTPAKKVELGEADFALCPTESIISYRTKAKPFDMIALAAVLQEDLSAIVVKKNSGINSPKDLDGKSYSSYQARYEDGIVKEMIKNDGGNGDIEITYPAKLGIWDTLLDGKADSTWIFINWEGVAAKDHAEQLQYFKMKDYEIPYSYSPVIAASEGRITEKSEEFKAFLKATKQGFLFCQDNPEEAISILSKYVPEKDRHIDLNEALKITATHFGDTDTWGTMEEVKVAKFLNWIALKGLEESTLELKEIMSNTCL